LRCLREFLRVLFANHSAVDAASTEQLAPPGPLFGHRPSTTLKPPSDRIAFCSGSYYHAVVETISVKLPPAMRRKLAAEASRRNVAQSVIVRESIERALANSSNSKEPASCAEVAGDLIGALRSGRKDSATNKALLEKAMMQSDRRGSKRRR